MTKAQKKIASGWVLIIFLLVNWAIFDEWILEHWEIIQWPLFTAVFIALMFSNAKKGAGEGRQEINRIVKENPWIKIYLAIYGIALAIGVNYIIFNNINISKQVGTFELLCTILLLILPIFIIKQKEAYIEAGKEI